MSAELTPAEEASAILDVAEPAFIWDDAELWGAKNPVAMFTLRKAIVGHPKGSTVTRETILAALAKARGLVPPEQTKTRHGPQTGQRRTSYGSFRLGEGDEASLDAVENPRR